MSITTKEAICILSVLASWLWLIASAFGAPIGTANNVQIGSQVVMGLQSVYPQLLLQYQEPSTTTAQFSGATTVVIPANTTDNAIDVSTLFPAFATPVCIGLQDVTDPGKQVNVGLSAGGPRIEMSAGGFMIFRTAGGLNTFYIDNPSSDTDVALRVFGLSN